MRRFRCGYPSPKPTRRAVNFNGERRHTSVPRADNGVDIPAPTSLETLCNRTVSEPDWGSGIVDILRRRPIATLCISRVRVTASSRRNPCRTGRELQLPHSGAVVGQSRAFPAGGPPAPTRRPSRPNAVRENSLKFRQKAAQFFSPRARPSKMRKNILGCARKNRAIRCRPPRVVQRPAAQPRTAQSGDIPHDRPLAR